MADASQIAVQGVDLVKQATLSHSIENDLNRYIISALGDTILNNPILSWDRSLKYVFALCFIIGIFRAVYESSNMEGLIAKFIKIAFLSGFTLAICGQSTAYSLLSSAFAVPDPLYQYNSPNKSLDRDIFNWTAYHADQLAQVLDSSAQGGDVETLYASNMSRAADTITYSAVASIKCLFDNGAAKGTCYQETYNRLNSRFADKQDPQQQDQATDQNNNSSWLSFPFAREIKDAIEWYYVNVPTGMFVLKIAIWLCSFLQSMISKFIVFSFGLSAGVSLFFIKLFAPFLVMGGFEGRIKSAFKVVLSTALFAFTTKVVLSIGAAMAGAIADGVQNLVVDRAKTGEIGAFDLFYLCLAIGITVVVIMVMQIKAISDVPKLSRNLLDLSIEGAIEIAQGALRAAGGAIMALGGAGLMGAATIATGGLAAAGSGLMAGLNAAKSGGGIGGALKSGFSTGANTWGGQLSKGVGQIAHGLTGSKSPSIDDLEDIASGSIGGAGTSKRAGKRPKSSGGSGGDASSFDGATNFSRPDPSVPGASASAAAQNKESMLKKNKGAGATATNFDDEDGDLLSKIRAAKAPTPVSRGDKSKEGEEGIIGRTLGGAAGMLAKYTGKNLTDEEREERIARWKAWGVRAAEVATPIIESAGGLVASSMIQGHPGEHTAKLVGEGARAVTSVTSDFSTDKIQATKERIQRKERSYEAKERYKKIASAAAGVTGGYKDSRVLDRQTFDQKFSGQMEAFTMGAASKSQAEEAVKFLGDYKVDYDGPSEDEFNNAKEMLQQAQASNNQEQEAQAQELLRNLEDQKYMAEQLMKLREDPEFVKEEERAMERDAQLEQIAKEAVSQSALTDEHIHKINDLVNKGVSSIARSSITRNKEFASLLKNQLSGHGQKLSDALKMSSEEFRSKYTARKETGKTIQKAQEADWE